MPTLFQLATYANKYIWLLRYTSYEKSSMVNALLLVKITFCIDISAGGNRKK